MAYLPITIANARQILESAQLLQSQHQQLLTALVQQRDTALTQRNNAQTQLNNLQPQITERTQKQNALAALQTQETNYNNTAASHGTQVQNYQNQMNSLQTQLNTLNNAQASIPSLQSAVNQARSALNVILDRQEWLFENPPEDPSDRYDYYQELQEVARQKTAAEGELASAQGALTHAQNQAAQIPTVQGQLTTATNNRNYYAGLQNSTLQSAADTRTAMVPVTTRINELNNILANVPTLQVTITNATRDLELLAPQITDRQNALSAAEAQVALARAPYDALLALVAPIDGQPLNRSALLQSATQLNQQLQEKLTAYAAATARLNEATRRREVVLTFWGQKNSLLSTLNSESSALSTTLQNLAGYNGQIPTQEANLQTALSNKSTVRSQILSHSTGRPKWNKPGFPPPDDFDERLRNWGIRMDELEATYQGHLTAETTARDTLTALNRTLLDTQGVYNALGERITALTGEIATLLSQSDALYFAIQAAQSELNGLQTPITEYRAAYEAATARLLGQLPTSLPVLLFPVRLETRFATSNELWVRIYPDDIHIDSHEPELTEEERTWGTHFRQTTLVAGTDTEAKRAAWEQLAQRFGVTRAAWIARVAVGEVTTGDRTSSWTRAPHTRILPDRWVALGYRYGKAEVVHWSEPLIPDTLPVGPSPSALPTQGDPFQDPAIAWLTDFNIAVQTGMGLRIPLTPVQRQEGFERLVVVGVKGFLATKEAWQASDAQEAVTRLTTLLNAHHYTRGMAFVPQRTPTNNTNSQAAGYATPDPLDEAIYTLERGTPLVTSNDGSDGSRTATALGVAAATFAHIRNANSREQSDAQIANAALYPSFQSHFLEAILPAPANAADHFAQYVRARGPFPALRVGNQPYGLLPITSLERWVAQANQEDAQLAVRLRTQRPLWQIAGERTARMGRKGDITRILRQGAGAHRYQIRGIGGVNKNGTLPRNQVVAPFASRLTTLHDRPVAVRQALVSETLETGAFRLDSWVTSLATRRLAHQRTGGATGIHLGAYGWVEGVRPAGPRANKGYLQAPSIAQATTAAVLRSGYLAHQQSGHGDGLAVNLSSERVRRTRWVLDGVRGGQSLSALLGYRFERALQDHRLAHYIAPFRTLASLREDKEISDLISAERDAERLYRERQATVATLTTQLASAEQQLATAHSRVEQNLTDKIQRQSLLNLLTAAHNTAGTRQSELDAATQAVQNHRANKPRSRTYKPYTMEGESPDYYLPGSETIATWQTTLTTLLATQSARQADYNAAVQTRDNLAGGANQYNSRVTTLTTEISNLENVRPTLESTRNAAQVFVNDTANALNGTNGNGGATRQMNDAHTAWQTASQELRDLLNERWQQALESVTAQNVVDGLELHRRWQLGQVVDGIGWNAASIPWGDPLMGLPALNSDDQQKLNLHLQALDETVDAVSDVLVAEGVYQLVQGNSTRAGTTLEAIATGKVAPPELEVIRTPRTGTALTHRLLALTHATLPTSQPWGATATNPRAKAEPYLNRWVAEWIANPSTVKCRVTFHNPETNTTVGQPQTVTLNVLGLSPLDALYLAESTGAAAESELEQRLAYHALSTTTLELPTTVQVHLDFGRQTGWAATDLSVAEWLENIRAVRVLVTQARAVDARDVAEPGPSIPLGINISNLQQRVQAVVSDFQSASQTLQTKITSGAVEELRTALLSLASFGIGGTIPVHARGTGEAIREDLVAQAEGVVQEVQRRLALLTTHDSQPPSGDTAAQRDFIVTRLHLILGDGFRILPIITIPTETGQVFDMSRNLEGQPLGAVHWLQQVSPVRPGVQRFQKALTYAEAVGSGATYSLRVGQLPYATGDRWIALPTPAGQSAPTGRLSMVAHLGSGFTFGAALVGLMIDEWVEVVPNRTEVTGLAFHYDQPSAQAPQSLLLAVAPDLRPGQSSAWDLDTLAATLTETADLARVRAAAPESLAGGLWHTLRRPDTGWDPFTNIDDTIGEPAPWQSVTVTPLSHSLHMVATTQPGGIWHTVRDPQGAWRAWESLGARAGDRGIFREVAAATVGNTIHVCAITPTGLWHSICFENGEWQPFHDVQGPAQYRGVPQKVAVAAEGGALHVLMVTQDGKLWHTVRYADGSWQPFMDAEQIAGDCGFIVSVSCAMVNNLLHICVSSTTGLWHCVRTSILSWTVYGDVQGQAGARGFVEDVAAAANGAEFYLRILTQDGQVWHTTRLANGAWTAFQRTEGVGLIRRLSCAYGVNGWHLADIAAPIAAPTLHFASNSLDLNALPG